MLRRNAAIEPFMTASGEPGRRFAAGPITSSMRRQASR